MKKQKKWTEAEWKKMMKSFETQEESWWVSYVYEILGTAVLFCIFVIGPMVWAHHITYGKTTNKKADKIENVADHQQTVGVQDKFKPVTRANNMDSIIAHNGEGCADSLKCRTRLSNAVLQKNLQRYL